MDWFLYDTASVMNELSQYQTEHNFQLEKGNVPSTDNLRFDDRLSDKSLI